MIDAAAKEIGFPAEIIADREQRLTNSLLYNFAMGTLYGLSYPKEPKLSELPLTEQIYVAQKKAIEEAAKRGSCVFIGRCADYVLRDMDNVVKIYLYAPIRDCMRRVIRLYELNPEDAKSLIHSMNKTRGNYYQHNTGLNWSEAVHYDICLNTAGLKKEKIIDIIKNYIKTKID